MIFVMSNHASNLKPSVASVLSTVFLRQIRVFAANKLLIFTNIFLFVLSLIVIKFILGDAVGEDVTKMLEILFVIYSIMLSTDLIIIKDYKHGVFEQFILSGVLLEYFILAKLLAALVVYIATYTPVLMIVNMLNCKTFALNNSNVCYEVILKILIISNVTITVILSSSFMLSQQKKLSQISLSLLISIPMFILYAICYKSSNMYCLILLLAALLLNLTLAILASSYLIKVATEESI
jgi:hypothetical protein